MKKKILFILVPLLVTLLFILGFLYFLGRDYKLDTDETEAYMSLRLAIAKSDLTGKISLTEEQFKILDNLTKKSNDTWFSGDWFSKNQKFYYGEIIDTSKEQVTTISNFEYAATFKVKENNGEYTLIEYNFECLVSPNV